MLSGVGEGTVTWERLGGGQRKEGGEEGWGGLQAGSENLAHFQETMKTPVWPHVQTPQGALGPFPGFHICSQSVYPRPTRCR